MRLFITLLVICSYVSLAAQSTLLSFDYQRKEEVSIPVRQINDQGLIGISVKYHFESAQVTSITAPILKRKNSDFQMLSVPGFSHLQEVGRSALPSHIDLIAVPKGALFSLENIKITRNLHKGYRIYPALKPARDTEGAPEPEFEMDKDFYKQNQFFPQNPVRIIEKINLRGMDFLLVEVVPVQYNPASSEIYTISDVSYQIKFTSVNSFFDYQSHTPNFINTILDLPLNSQGFKTDYKNYLNSGIAKSSLNNSGSKNYIIITQDAFLAAADSLASWKQQLGYSTEVVSAPSWTAANVKNAIHSRYQNWTPKPDYFVIIGDVQQVPTDMFTSPDGTGTYGTDLYYACMGGGNDYIPEMARGRISVSSATEAMMVVKKIINYERNPVSDSSFYQNSVNCAQFQDDNLDGYADRRFTHTSEDVRNYVVNHGYNVQRIYYTDPAVYPYNYNASYYSNGQSIPSALLKTSGYPWNGGATDIKNSINSGKFYVLHRDHGYSGGYGWAHPYYTKTKINQLTNGNKYEILYLFTNNIDNTEMNPMYERVDERTVRLKSDDILNMFKSLIDSDLIGQAKQVKQYRDWVAHRNISKGAPANVPPKKAYEILSEILRALPYSPILSSNVIISLHPSHNILLDLRSIPLQPSRRLSSVDVLSASVL